MRNYILAGLICTSAATSTPRPVAAAGEAARVVLLGTKGGPSVDAERSESANLLVVDGRRYLIDAGEGTARQLAASGIPPVTVRTVFLTHHHLDHTAGLEPLMALMWAGAAFSGKPALPVDIYGPPATDFLVGAAIDYISVSERIFRAGLPTIPNLGSMFAAHVIDKDGVAYRDDLVRVTAVENTHFSHASRGPDGRRDMSFSYRFDTPSGSVVFTGDTGPSSKVAALAQGADMLVSEVYLSNPGPLGSDAGAATSLGRQLAAHMREEHLSPEEAGKLAADAGVKTLVLTHIVAKSSPNLQHQLKERVARIFSGRIVVADDLLNLHLSR